MVLYRCGNDFRFSMLLIITAYRCLPLLLSLEQGIICMVKSRGVVILLPAADNANGGGKPPLHSHFITHQLHSPD